MPTDDQADGSATASAPAPSAQATQAPATPAPPVVLTHPRDPGTFSGEDTENVEEWRHFDEHNLHSVTMAKFNPSREMPARVLHDLVTVRQCMGVHWDFPYGNTYTIFDNVLMPPIFNGYTFRVFFFMPTDKGETSVEFYYSDKWYVKSAVKDGIARVYYSDKKANEQSVNWDRVLNAGDYYSAGVRVTNTKYLQPIFNDLVGAAYDMDGGIEKWRKSYQMRIHRGQHIILSIHISDEENRDFPEYGLLKGEQLFDFPAGYGSTTLVLYMVTDPNETPFYGIKGTLLYGFQGLSLKKGDLFQVMFRNLPTKVTAVSDYDHVPRVLPFDKFSYNLKEPRKFLSPVCSNSICIKRVNQDCI